MTPRQRVLAAAAGEPTDQVPVTPLFMRFAAQFVGRSFRDYYLDGSVLAQAQIEVAREFGTDTVAVTGEPYAEADAYGMTFDYPEDGVGVPQSELWAEEVEMRALTPLAPNEHPRLAERLRCVERMKQEVGETHALVGWVEGPLAIYATLRGLEQTMADLFDQPDVFTEAASFLADQAAGFAQAQIDAGADIIGIGDAAASLIGPDFYRRFVVPAERRLIERIHRGGALVKLHVCGNIHPLLADMVHTGADLIDIDWMVPLSDARHVVGSAQVLCGNANPAGPLLRGTPDEAAEEARASLRDGGQPLIIQPGCEVPPDTPHENLRAYIRAAQEGVPAA